MRWLSRCWWVCVLVGSLGVVSCATVMRSGGPGGVTITSEPPAAQVTITNLWTRQTILQATTPAVASLARQAGYMQPARYQVVVAKPGYQPYVITLQAHLNDQYFGNLVAGGPLGFFVIDPLTGAMYTLPSQVHAVLVRADDAGVAPYPSQPSPYLPQFPPYSSQPQFYPPLPYEERGR